MKFAPKREHGGIIYCSDDAPNLSLVKHSDQCYHIRVKDGDSWCHPTWGREFDTIEAAEKWLNWHDYANATADMICLPAQNRENDAELIEAATFLGFESGPDAYIWSNSKIQIEAAISIGQADLTYIDATTGKQFKHYTTIDAASLIRHVEKTLRKHGHTLFNTFKTTISAAINTRELTSDIIRCKSSNVWGYKFNVRKQGDQTGDLIMQFKGKNGGPGGGLYIFFDVPVRTYRRLIAGPSIGHNFWVYIRNNFKYSRLDGSKRGVLPNAVNNYA